MLKVVYDGASGNSVHYFSPSTGRWRAVGIPCAANVPCDSAHYLNYPAQPGQMTNNTYYAIDVPGRWLYFIHNGISGLYPCRLFRYGIDSGSLYLLGECPEQGIQEYPMLAWDSINKVLFWWTAWENHGSKLWIYHPDVTGGDKAKEGKVSPYPLGVTEAELEADVRRTLRRFMYALSGDAP